MAGTPTRYGRDTFEVFTIQPWRRRDDDSIELHYDLGPHHFVETVAFGVRGLPPTALVDLLAAVAGVSYFKASAPRTIRSNLALTVTGIDVVRAAYDQGLREFAYRNGLDVPLTTVLDIDTCAMPPVTPAGSTLLITLGGGRDSALTAAALRGHPMELMTVGSNDYADRIGDVLGQRVIHGSRTISPDLIRLNGNEAVAGPALNGHVPVTGINSLMAACTASLLGCGDVVMSNEASSNHASHVTADGVEINHQYSKSWAFEQLLARAVKDVSGLRYFSAIRPWGELAVAKAFVAFPELHRVIMSCNRAFVRDPSKRSYGWCGHCDKCRFVFLSLAPFMTPSAMTAMFDADLLAGDDVDGFADLFAELDRPWDCVGEPEEVRALHALLANSSAWSGHHVVDELKKRFGVASGHNLDTLLAPHGDHGIPDHLWADIAAVFAR